MNLWAFDNQNGETLRFAEPWWLLGLLVLPMIFLIMRWREKRSRVSLLHPAVGIIAEVARQGRFRRRAIPHVLRCVILGLFILALARPQYGRIERSATAEGIDIALILDVSLSMRTGDFNPSRLEVAKQVVSEFVKARNGDRISLTVFGSDAVTLVPFTLDYAVLDNFIKRIGYHIVNGDKTAVGMGLINAVSKLKDSEAKSKVAILLTDGENNAGRVDPIKAAEAARTLNIKVYTIGVGSDQAVLTPFGIQNTAGIDEESLKKIADMTGGLYFRATDRDRLVDIYEQIDKLEKTEVESNQFDNFNEMVHWLLFPAGLLWLLELLLRATRFVAVP